MIIPVLAGLGAYFAGGAAADKMVGSVANGIASFIFGPLIIVTGGVLTFLLGAATYFVTFVLELNFKLLDTTGGAYNFISVGWTIMRDIANLGFVLFIIIIALATIVRFRDYEAKQLLPRLIGAAILVNFSLAIPSIFINFSDVLSNYFLNKIGLEQNEQGNFTMTGSAKFALALGSIANPSLGLGSGDPTELLKDWAGEKTLLKAVADFSQKLWGLMFLLVAIFIIGALGVLFLVRFITLHFLLVLAPIVWLFWVIPGLSGQFGAWWKKFLQTTFFLPISIFFLYLTIGVGKKLNTITQNADMSLFSAKGAGEGIRVMMQQLAASYVVLAFLIGSVIAGQKLSISGAENVLKTGKNFIDKGKVWAKKGAKAGSDAAVRSQPAQKLANRLSNSRFKVVRKIGEAADRTVYQKQLEAEKKAKEKITKTSRDNEQNLGRRYQDATTVEQGQMLTTVAPKMADLQKGREDAERDKNSAEKNAENKGAILENTKNDKNSSFNSLPNKLQPIETAYINATRAYEKMDDKTSSEERAKITTTKDQAKTKRDEEFKNYTPGEGEDEKTVKDNIKDYREKEAAWLTAQNEYREADDKLKKNEKSVEKATRAEEQYKTYIIDQFPNHVVEELKAEHYKLENTNLPGASRAREGKLPDLNIDKVQKEFDKIAETFKKTEDEFKAIQTNPFTSQEDLAKAENKFNIAKKIHDEKKAYTELFAEVDKGWKTAWIHEKEFIEERTKEGYDTKSMKRHGDYKKVAEEKKKALEEYYAVISGNHPRLQHKITPPGAPLREPAFGKKASKKDDE